MDIYLIRHAQGEHNLQQKRVWGHSPQIPLTPKGRKQSQHLKSFFNTLPNKHEYYASTAIRAKDTITIGSSQTQLTIDPAFNEISRGEYEGFEISQLPQYLKEDWRRDPHGAKAPNGENFLEAGERFYKGLEKVAQAQKNKSPLVIGTHGNVMKAFYFGMLHEIWDLALPENNPIPNTGIIHIAWEGKFIIPTTVPYPVYNIDHLPKDLR